MEKFYLETFQVCITAKEGETRNKIGTQGPWGRASRRPEGQRLADDTLHPWIGLPEVSALDQRSHK